MFASAYLLALTAFCADNPTLQGQIWRANIARTGEFKDPGPQKEPKLKWKFATGGAVKSSPVICDGTVFIGSDDGNLYALDLETGKQIWQYKAGAAILSSPAIYGGTVFFTNPKGLHALDAKTGKKIWMRQAGLWDDSPLVLPGPIRHKDGKTLDGIVFYSEPWKNLVGLDIRDGMEVWRCRDAHGPGSRGCSALIHRGMIVYFRGSQATVLVDLLTERKNYEIDGGIDNGVFTPTARDGICYSYIDGIVAFDMMENAAVNAKTGSDYKMKWRFNPGKQNGWDGQHPGISSISVDEKNVYFGHTDCQIYALDRETGEVRWKSKTGGVNRSSPALGSAELLFVGSYDGCMYGISKNDGKIAWKFPVGGPIHSSPAVEASKTVFGSDDGNIYAIE